MTPQTFNNGNCGKLSNMIYISLAAHLVVITIVMISIPTAARHLTFGPVYSVQLVSSAAVLPRSSQSELMKEIEKSSEASNSIIYKRQVTGLAPTPAKKEETARLNVDKAVSAIKQKQANEVPPVTGARPAPAAGSAARSPSGEFSSWEKEYSAATRLRIKRNFNIPSALVPKENVEAIISIKILRDGSLDYAGFEKHSGNKYLDDAALKAIKKSVPFAPFPEKIKETAIEIGIIFHPAQLR
jgi:colicin import membrane protein